MESQTEISNPVPYSPFPADKKEDMQVKIKDFSQDMAGNTIAYNMNTPECYEKGEVIEIPQNDFNFYMQVFEKYETNEKKRAECQRKYYLKNKKSYYERQKKWRDGKKVELNKRRREKYALKKLEATSEAATSEAANNHDTAYAAAAAAAASSQVVEAVVEKDEKVLLAAKA